MTNPERIVIIGSGNVAEALCRAIPTAENKIVQVFARNAQRGKMLAKMAGCDWENRTEKLASADIYLLAVSDTAIPPLSEELDFGQGLVAHTSGSCDLRQLSPSIYHRGVFYPLQTFTAGHPVNFREIPLFIEAENEADYIRLESLARSLTDSVYRSDSLLRQKMHVAAVFVCNFVNDLYSIGEQWMLSNGMDFSLLKPLIAETTHKMLDSPSPRSVQTGPAIREDWPTIEKHLELLEKYPDLQMIYKVLTEHIIQMKRKPSNIQREF